MSEFIQRLYTLLQIEFPNKIIDRYNSCICVYHEVSATEVKIMLQNTQTNTSKIRLETDYTTQIINQNVAECISHVRALLYRSSR